MALPAPARPTAPPRRNGVRSAAARLSASFSAWSDAAATRPWIGVTWNLAFIMLLLYLFDITTYTLRQSSLIMAVAVVGLMIQPGLIRLNLPLGLLGAVMAWSAIGVFASPWPEESTKHYIEYLKIFIICLVFYSAVRTRAQVRFVILLLLGAYAFWPVRGGFFNAFLYQSTIWGRTYWSNIFANPNDLAGFTLVPFALCLGLWVTEKKKTWIWWATVAGLVVLPLLVFMTSSRGGIIALGVLFLFAFGGQIFRPRVIGTLAIAAVVVVAFSPKETWERLRGLSKVTDVQTLSEADKEGSADQRFEIWKVARSIIADHPLEGVGIGMYSWAHYPQSRSTRFRRTAYGLRDAHSTYLRFAAEAGIPALLMFLAFIATTFAYAWEVRRRLRPTAPNVAEQIRYLQAGIVAYLVAGIFSSLHLIAFTYLYLTLLWCMAAANDPGAAAARAAAPASRPRRGIFPRAASA